MRLGIFEFRLTNQGVAGGAVRRLLGDFPGLSCALLLVSSLSSIHANAQTLTITATGQISASCGLSANGNFTSANLDINGSSSATAAVNCNTKYLLKATSTNGGLKTAISVPSSSFANKLDYQFNISVPLDNSASTVTGSCAASNLIAGASTCALSPAGPGLSSGSGTSTAKTATLGINWTLPSTVHLVAGSYADTITISIAAQP